MILDTSAFVAVLLGEKEGDDLLATMLDADSLAMSAATYLECAIVVDRRVGPAGRVRFDRILDTLGVDVVPFTAEHARLGRAAYDRYGKGTGHPASLNLGDCFAYALSAASGEPLLFVGDDFGHTDLTPARRQRRP